MNGVKNLTSVFKFKCNLLNGEFWIVLFFWNKLEECRIGYVSIFLERALAKPLLSHQKHDNNKFRISLHENEKVDIFKKKKWQNENTSNQERKYI